MSSPALFLHGGPAMGAAMERASYPQLADCHWWDQPRPAAGTRRPYHDLLDAAEVELRRLAALHGEPLTLLANSFGAVLATHLARVAPQLIACIVLLAPVAELEQGLLRVARHVVQFSEVPAPALQAALAAHERAQDRESYWAMFHALLPHPSLSSQYWLPGSSRAAWFAQMLALPEMFDLAAHMAIADDYQRAPLLPQAVPFSGPVELIFGAADPLTDAVAAAAWWRQCYPQAQARRVAAAHFPHLELPPSAWLPAA
ncbi:alpha/beta fold hydrolase [Pseudoduganella sp. FT55W]|uniref:Alpha/beta fold hydrolase n=1 Tax=Duganella rivi TaxID=2666083 RepID=A0A7X4GNP4_9BURK|nr:alpha/beta hydrolase [Duganella rivi]MYM66350.1 alpha/beta fold hydrolase [Duganella rivi]